MKIMWKEKRRLKCCLMKQEIMQCDNILNMLMKEKSVVKIAMCVMVIGKTNNISFQ